MYAYARMGWMARAGRKSSYWIANKGQVTNTHTHDVLSRQTASHNHTKITVFKTVFWDLQQNCLITPSKVKKAKGEEKISCESRKPLTWTTAHRTQSSQIHLLPANTNALQCDEEKKAATETRKRKWKKEQEPEWAKCRFHRQTHDDWSSSAWFNNVCSACVCLCHSTYALVPCGTTQHTVVSFGTG